MALKILATILVFIPVLFGWLSRKNNVFIVNSIDNSASSIKKLSDRFDLE